jgi:PAS domain S-box-containing protein
MASEERFRSVVESATDGIILADHNGFILSWNKAAARLFGYTEEEVAGRPLTLLMPARYRAAHERGLERLRSTGETRVIGKTLELHGLRKDGNEFPLELSLATWKTKEGAFFSGIIRDITARKQVEEALRESQERLELAVRGSTDGLWDGRPLPVEHWSSPRTPVWWSPQFRQLLGFADEEFPDVLESWASRLHSDDKERVFAALTAHIERKEPYDVEYRLLTKQGEYRWFRARGQAIWDAQGRLLRMAGSLQCITDRKRAEEALRESEARFRQLAENIREVFWMTDPEKNRMIYISPGYEEIWGRTCESLYAAPRAWLEAIHPEDRDRVLQAALTKQVTGTYNEEYRIVRPDGSVRWIWDRAFPVRDASGQVYRIAGIAEDITKLKQAP